MGEIPSPAAGLRLALRLYKLVLAGWLVTLAAFVPAHAVVAAATASVRANLPAAPAPDDEALIFVERLAPVSAPLTLAVLSGCLAFAAWSVLWHAGTVRWWLSAGAVRVRLAEIIGHGVVWWWRYARFSLVAVIVPLGLLAGVWLPVLRLARTVESQTAAILLATALAVSAVAVLLCWPAALRGAWLLGESGRRSALVAWLRGLGAVVHRPLRSLLPLPVWALPGAALLAAPLAVNGSAALPTLLAAPLASSFCWVALYLSYAPQEPPEEWVRKMQARAAAHAARPRTPPDPQETGRIPTQTSDR
jgi:hypothetical protein